MRGRAESVDDDARKQERTAKNLLCSPTLEPVNFGLIFSLCQHGLQTEDAEENEPGHNARHQSWAIAVTAIPVRKSRNRYPVNDRDAQREPRQSWKS